MEKSGVGSVRSKLGVLSWYSVFPVSLSIILTTAGSIANPWLASGGYSENNNKDLSNLYVRVIDPPAGMDNANSKCVGLSLSIAGLKN